MFQSLLWWIAVVNRVDGDLAELSDRVSILVVVDWQSSTDDASTVHRVIASCFNPCCGGLAVVNTRVDAIGCRSRECFNPCCGGLQSSTASMIDATGSEFQSLLWWIAVVNRMTRSDRRIRCFNPCCGGLQSSTRSRSASHVPGDAVSILVVVDCSRQLRPCGLTATMSRCFNPCCGGLQSSTWPIGSIRLVVDVSILVVVDCSRQRRLARSARDHAVFQSLLWWIAVVNSIGIGSHDDRCSFNPCCRGLQSSTAGNRCDRESPSVFQSLLSWIAVVNAAELPDARPDDRVSILVVVDCSRQHWIAVQRSCTRHVMFQSLLWWIAVVNVDARPEPVDRRVSILVVVDCSRQPRSGRGHR